MPFEQNAAKIHWLYMFYFVFSSCWIAGAAEILGIVVPTNAAPRIPFCARNFCALNAYWCFKPPRDNPSFKNVSSICKTTWWFQPISNIFINLEQFPKVRGENETCLSCHHLDKLYTEHMRYDSGYQNIFRKHPLPTVRLLRAASRWTMENSTLLVMEEGDLHYP